MRLQPWLVSGEAALDARLRPTLFRADTGSTSVSAASLRVWFMKAHLGTACALALLGSPAFAADDFVKIGVLGDMSGVYADGFSGRGAVAAVQMAVDDFGGSVLGHKIEILTADHQNKPDVGSAIARKWADEDHVTMITDMTNSAVALAIQKAASDKKVINITTGGATADLTGKACTKYGIHYGYDTNALSVGTATAMVKSGGKSWYFITADYTFGHTLEQTTGDTVKALGGTVLGSSAAPLATTDFSSYLLAAQSSGAQVVGLANAGTDTINSIKQAHEFGLTDQGTKLAGMLVLISDVASLGTDTAKGLQFTVGWYWNSDDQNRAWAARFAKASNNAAPTFPHAADYSLTIAYLNAVKAVGSTDPDKVREQLGRAPIDDFFARGGRIRADGLLEHDMYLVKVKSAPAGSWDVATVEQTIPGNVAYPPVERSGCPLVSK